MIVETLLRNLDNLGIAFDAYHYRTRGGAEIDLILEGDFGLLPIEIKYTHATDRRHLRSLSDFIARHGCPYGLVIDNHDRPSHLTETIVSLPAAAL